MGKVVKKIGKAIGSVFKAVGNFVGMLFSPPKQPKATANASSETRLNASLVPEETFKIIFGETAVGTDMRFWETYGTGNNGHVQIFAGACHEMTSYGNLYLDERPVPFTGNDATAAFVGLLSRRMVLKGVSGAGIALGSGTRWTAASAMTGCSWYALIWTYNAEKMPQGIPSRITQVGKGAKVYDPRRDSTRGGAGAHRANNPATWEYTPLDSNGQPIGRNNALQMLTYELGIFAVSPVTGLWVLRAGRGVDPADINFDTFITAANACEIEGWYSDCILSTGDSHSTNEGILEAAAGGELVDTGGRFSYYVSTDDTANVAAYFTEDDIVGDIDWEPQKAMSEQFNELPGTFTDPAALFQTRPLPLCWSQSYYDADGYKRRGEPEKLSAVQDPAQGQKLLRRKLNKSRFQGVFTAPFNLKALKVRHHDIIRLTFKPFGWTDKLFRVSQQGIGPKGGIQLVLEEDDAAIYLPGAVVAVPAPGVGNGGDAFLAYDVVGFTAVPTGVLSGTSARDAMNVYFTVPGEQIDRTEGRYRKTGDVNWTPLAPLRRDQLGWIVEPLLPTTGYTFQARHVTLWNVPGQWAQVAQTTNAVTINPAGQLVYANGQTVESLKPQEAGANVTETRTALFLNGEGPWARETTPVNSLLRPNANILFNGGFKLKAQGFRSPLTANYDPQTGDYGVMSGQGRITEFAACTPNQYLTFSGEFHYALAEVPIIYIAFWSDAAGTNYVGEGAYITGLNYNRVAATPVLVPNTAIRYSLHVTSPNWNAGYIVARKLKIENGTVATPWSDEATDGALYYDGLNIDLLRPEEIGGNRTETRTALFLNGEGVLARRNDITDGYLGGSLANRLSPFPGDANFLQAGHMAWAAGETLEYWKPGEPGANITETRTALFLNGEGSLARRNNIDSDNYLGGSLANRLAPFSGDNNYLLAGRVAWDGTGNTVLAFKPQEAGANITENRTAAFLSGEGPWARLATPVTHLTQPGSNILYNGALKLGGQGFSGNGGTGYLGIGEDTFSGRYMSVGAGQVIGDLHPCDPGTTIVLSGEFFQHLTSTTWYVAFYDAAVAYKTEGMYVGGTSWTRQTSQPYTVPAGLGITQFRLVNYTPANPGYSLARKLKIEIGTVATPFNDDRTNSALYRDGVSMEVLRPEEGGSNKTETRTAAFLNGEGPWARESAVTPTIINGRTSKVDNNGRIIDGSMLPINGNSKSSTISPIVALSPGATPSTQINVAAVTVTFAGGSTLYVGSATISGLAADTVYSVFRDLTNSVYVAVASDTTPYFTSAQRYLYVGSQRTELSEGGYTPPPPPPPGYGGGFNDIPYYVEP